MVDTMLLEKKIENSGLKKKYIAKELGISVRALSMKLKGIVEFKSREQKKLMDILGIETIEEMNKIFYAQNFTKS